MRTTVRATPALDLAGKISIAFVFAGSFPRIEDAHAGLNLDHLRDHLDRREQALRDAYVRPLDAFIRDICDPATAGMHFPLMMQLPSNPDAAADRATIHFPETFDYSAEGRDVSVTGIRRSAACRFRESFAFFETGRFYYTICFYQDADAPDPLDEYGALQLLQLAEPTYLKRNVQKEILFDFGGGRVPALDAVNARLATAMREPGNCIHDIAMAQADATPVPFRDWESLSHCMVQIDDPQLLHLTQTLGREKDGPPPPESYAPTGDETPGTIPGHGNEELPPPLRALISLAGLCQNVCDFPYQDPSEVEDSLRPIYADAYLSFFFRRRIFVEISEASRPLAAARGLIGICPYLFCVCLLIRFDEHLLEKGIALIRQMASIDAHALRVHPFSKLFRTLETADDPISGSSRKDFRFMLEKKIELLCDFHFRFLASPFRYETEREMFGRALERRSVTRRYEDINALIERHSQRIDEIQRIGEGAAASLLNILILALTAVQAVVILKDFFVSKNGEGAPDMSDLPHIIFYAVGLVFLLILARPFLRFRRARRRSSREN
jgi:hypothetical protein